LPPSSYQSKTKLGLLEFPPNRRPLDVMDVEPVSGFWPTLADPDKEAFDVAATGLFGPEHKFGRMRLSLNGYKAWAIRQQAKATALGTAPGPGGNPAMKPNTGNVAPVPSSQAHIPEVEVVLKRLAYLLAQLWCRTPCRHVLRHFLYPAEDQPPQRALVLNPFDTGVPVARDNWPLDRTNMEKNATKAVTEFSEEIIIDYDGALSDFWAWGFDINDFSEMPLPALPQDLHSGNSLLFLDKFARAASGLDPDSKAPIPLSMLTDWASLVLTYKNTLTPAQWKLMTDLGGGNWKIAPRLQNWPIYEILSHELFHSHAMSMLQSVLVEERIAGAVEAASPGPIPQNINGRLEPVILAPLKALEIETGKIVLPRLAHAYASYAVLPAIWELLANEGFTQIAPAATKVQKGQLAAWSKFFAKSAVEIGGDFRHPLGVTGYTLSRATLTLEDGWPTGGAP
jgi:hypothetical protein